jgi:hypothetical protein
LKLEPLSKKELKSLTREEEERTKRDNQDKKRRKSYQSLLPLNKLLLKLALLNRSQLRRREKPEEEDQDKVNNDLFVYECKIIDKFCSSN